METRKPETQFREDEIAFIKHFDKQRQEWVVNPHSKVSGRLCQAHEGNESLTVEANILRCNWSPTVGSSIFCSAKGRFKIA